MTAPSNRDGAFEHWKKDLVDRYLTPFDFAVDPDVMHKLFQSFLEAIDEAVAYERQRLLDKLPARKEEFKQGRFIRGEREWNECLDEIRERLGGEK